MDFLGIDLLGPQPIFSETVQHVENLQFGDGCLVTNQTVFYIVGPIKKIKFESVVESVGKIAL
jgi:hypothetical protein